MKKLIQFHRLGYLFILFIGIALALSCQTRRSDKRPIPIVKDGVLDLTNWNFAVDGPLQLKGDWKFRWFEDKEEDFIDPNYDDSHWDTLKVPGYWNHRVKQGHGFGWFRVKIITGENRNLGLYINHTHSSYNIYANGKFIARNGVAGNTLESSEPQLLLSLIHI